MDYLQGILRLCSYLTLALTVLFSYRILFGLVGFFTTKRFAPAKNFHKYAIVIAARNEEAVIGQLLESIRLQEYPAEKLTVFVVADNCTDRTAQIARANGAVCYCRQDPHHCTKGYALQFLFRQIRRDYGISSFDGYFLFDADNLLDRHYVARMNDAFDSGEKIITSYRSSKNFLSSPVAASYAFHWMRTARMESRGRSVLHVATRLQGTGFLFAWELVKDGWEHTSLTEDRAFTAQAVTRGYHITYQDAALFYDEQPVSMHIALRQRLRWGKGHLQAYVQFRGPLLSYIFHAPDIRRRISAIDTLATVLPSMVYYVVLELVQFAAQIGMALLPGAKPGQILAYGAGVLRSFLVAQVGIVLLAVILLFTERRRLPPCPLYKKLLYCLFWPTFDIIGKYTQFFALFTKAVWKPIPHKVALRLEDVEVPIG